MKKLITKFLFGSIRTEDVSCGNFLYEKADLSQAGRSIIPGDMTFDEWKEGGWSKYNHPPCIIKQLKIA